jgi:hypothetical protein
MSTSSNPTFIDWSFAKARDNWVATELLPTPPFPDITIIIFFILKSFRPISLTSGSGPVFNCPDEQIPRLGHPTQASDLPAFWDSMPGQCSGGNSIVFQFIISFYLRLKQSFICLRFFKNMCFSKQNIAIEISTVFSFITLLICLLFFK